MSRNVPAQIKGISKNTLPLYPHRRQLFCYSEIVDTEIKEIAMKLLPFRVHGIPAQRLDIYGTILLLLGMVLTFITTGLIGLSVGCLGGWLCWQALR